MRRSIALFLFCASPAVAAQLPITPQEKSNDMFGTWSPDGRQIAFVSDRSGDPEVYVANADGSGTRKLTDTVGRDAHPSWHPDGLLLFQSPREQGHTRIFSMKQDGSEQRSLAATTGFCGVPFASPDGNNIAFQCSNAETDWGTPGAPWRIYVLERGARLPELLTKGPGNDQVPNWSPDGRRLLFFSDRSGINQLYELTIPSSAVRQVTQGPASHAAASYSPDGRRIAVMRAEPGKKGDVFVIGADLTPVRITSTDHQFGQPLFSPDGKSLLMQLPTLNGWRLHVAPADGSGTPKSIEFR